MHCIFIPAEKLYTEFLFGCADEIVFSDWHVDLYALYWLFSYNAASQCGLCVSLRGGRCEVGLPTLKMKEECVVFRACGLPAAWLCKAFVSFV